MGKKVSIGTPDQDLRRIVFNKKDIKLVTKTLATLLKNAKVRCVLLVDKDGHLITKEGDFSTLDMDTIVALVAGSFAATQQMARLLGEKEYSIMFPEGEKNHIQLSLVGERTLLAVILDDTTTLGMVRLHAGQVSARLNELFKEILNRGHKGSDPFDGVGPTPLLA